jgi:hypothetical protein
MRRSGVETIADYHGGLLNHLEALYRPGDRELAIEFVEALGCTTTDTGFETETGSSYISVHPYGADSDPLNNVFYVSEMLPRQVQLEDLIRARIEGDAAIQDALAGYREKAKSFPFGIPHFGLRYPSVEALQPVLERLDKGVSPALKARVTVHPIQVFEAANGIPEVTQAFVYTDVVVTGSSALGQLIELQVQGSGEARAAA